MSRQLQAIALALAAVAGLGLSGPARAAGQIDEDTLIWRDHGRFNGVNYVEYQAMFEGRTSKDQRYRVPCQVIAPARPADGTGLLFFDWLNATTIFTAIGQDFPVYRYALTDEFLLAQGLVYATVRSDPRALGTPWMGGDLDTRGEVIKFEADEYEIVADFVRALQSDPLAVEIVGPVERTAAGAYSEGSDQLRGLLRMNLGRGLFDFALVGGGGYVSFPRGTGADAYGDVRVSTPPLAGAGREVAFNAESDVLALDGSHARIEAGNMCAYEFAGCTHINNVEAALAGLPDPDTANPADWFPLVRALFVAGDEWCDGIEPPPSIWLGTPGDPAIVRDAKGNALVQLVGQEPVDTGYFRLPEVGVGKNGYIPFDPTYLDDTLIGILRALAGGFVDLTHTFATHEEYVEATEDHAEMLLKCGYLLEPDAAAIIREAAGSEIGKR